MCELCSSDLDELIAARKHHKNIAERLRYLAQAYDDLASGRVKPHTEEWQKVKPRACVAINNLVSDWV